ncbi:MAG: metal ABC transporter substrate-binding protein [Clostridia bacterium]|nr:metal ABC transporter substrate-binding protein [Clostridia bacterium]
MKKIVSIISALLVCIFASGCKKNLAKQTRYVASCYPVYIITLNLIDGIEGTEVIHMSENHQGCLHDFQIQSEDLKNIEKSSAFIINGAGMENFLKKVTDEIPKIKIIDSSKDIKLLENNCHHHHHSHEHEYNPHIWMSIDNYIKQTENIAEGLIESDPGNEEKYKQNCEEYILKLKNLKNDITLKLKDVRGKSIITFHEAFPYFANEFGLNIPDVINHDPESEPSAKQISKTINIMKENNINSLFIEPQYKSTAAETISKETGAKIYTLDPAVTGENSKDAYIEIMTKNAETLKEALN